MASAVKLIGRMSAERYAIANPFLVTLNTVCNDTLYLVSLLLLKPQVRLVMVTVTVMAGATSWLVTVGVVDQ